MASKKEWLALAERCEKATGPDREIDDAIATATGLRVVYEGHPIGRCWYDRDRRAYPIERYSSSLDAITALIEREFPGGSRFSGHGKLSPDEPLGGAAIFSDEAGDNLVGEGEAATEPLARCAAFCRAMAGKVQ